MGSSGSQQEVCPECGRSRPVGRACPSCLFQLGLAGSSADLDDATLGTEGPVSTAEGESRLEIENFRILERLGEGGMGEVFAGEQLAPVRRRVALKVIKWGMDTRDVVARFEAERQALALMNHSSIARVFEAGATTEGRPFFAMELVDGVPITRFCDEHHLTTRQRIELFLQVCDGVHHAHRKGIIHRDLKPSNLLVSNAEGEPGVKIIDFGIAKATEQHLTEHTVFTEQGLLIGTPEYMSPEQAELSPFDIDTRSDVYSLGVVLYELLTGELPLGRDGLRQGSLLDIQRRIVEEEPPRPSTRVSRSDRDSRETAARRGTDVQTLRRSLAGDLDWIVMKTLEKDPDRRYESAAHLRSDLERSLRDEPVSAGPPGLRYRAIKLARRHRVAVAAGALVLAALVVGLVLALYGLVRARQAESLASAERDKAEAVNRFLVDTLSAASPYAAAGREVTVVETLAASVPRIDEAFSEQPEVRSELQLTIGWSYTELGAFDEAEPLLRAALADRLERHPEDDPRVAAAQRRLGVLLSEGSAFKEGADLLKRALETYRATLGPASDEATTTATELSMALSRLADYDEAIALLERTIEQQRGVDAPADKLGAAYNNLGILLLRNGRPKDAETAHLEGLRLRRAAFGDDHPEVAESLANLANVFKAQQRFDESESRYRTALQLLERHLGGDHLRVATIHNNLGGLYYQKEDYERAREHYETALRIHSSQLDGSHPATASLLNNLANIDFRLGRYEVAAEAHREVVALRRRIFGEIHPSVALSLSGIGSALHMGGRPAEALPVYEEALAIYRQTVGDDHWDTARVVSHRADCLRLVGRYAEAERSLLAALDVLLDTVGEGHRHTRLARERLVSLYDGWDRPELAAAQRALLADRP